ncbi:hypothetical protein [Aminipila terrae]|uniref:Fumarate reductase/succinate dehydrogenase flavoprotein-like C-terminal domain-containing protein n=1 Tax=Aminipila terrae TaxID=2697030 RepID=A0A6P1ML19_9FIRM|nr:hypothetical protein [Aminipila terrae]QHI72748.1 hypothetical protein Ami3637_10340 [Aminipila terrae]
MAAESAVKLVNRTEESHDASQVAAKLKQVLVKAENEKLKKEKLIAKYKAGNVPSSAVLAQLRLIMNDAMGIERNEKQILEGISKINVLIGKIQDMGPGDLDETEPLMTGNMLYLAKAMLLSASERKETRGAHIRKDYPHTDNQNFRKTTVASYFNDGTIDIAFKEVL